MPALGFGLFACFLVLYFVGFVCLSCSVIPAVTVLRVSMALCLSTVCLAAWLSALTTVEWEWRGTESFPACAGVWQV